MVSKRELSEYFNIGLVILMVLTCITNGLPCGPFPPDEETGFSFKSFKDFILAGFPSAEHIHDPSEMYMHQGQPPSVAEVAHPELNDQKLVVEKADDGTDGVQNIGDLIDQSTVIDNDARAAAVPSKDNNVMQEEPLEELDVPHDHPEAEYKGMMEKVPSEDNNVMQEEPLEELDVPHEHPEAEYKGMMEKVVQQALVVKDITLKEEI